MSNSNQNLKHIIKNYKDDNGVVAVPQPNSVAMAAPQGASTSRNGVGNVS